MNLKNSLRIFQWKFWMYRGLKKSLRQTKQRDNPVIKINKAVYETIYNRISPEEKTWINKIEKIRTNLNADKTPVSIVDFGAGKPDSKRSEKVMAEGITHSATIAETCKIASKPSVWALLLFKLIREFKPQTAIELGTCLGISASYQAVAQRINQQGRLITLEGSGEIAELAKKNFESLRLDNVSVITGRFNDTLPAVLETNHPIDYVFIDGHHDEQATIAYFENLLPYLSPQSLLVFDDISWSKGMRKAWNKIIRDKNVKLAVDLKMVGICLIEKKTILTGN
ncbi:putative O-methyltransferase [Bacteroidales bacterium Barb6XT]|nr:putative O-methyltransferase [Bacteroidales bacterium Barb6XT]